MPWSYAGASAIGTSHLRARTRLQDFSVCFTQVTQRGHDAFVSIIADGAGSAKFGGQGASIICRTFSSELRNALRKLDEAPNDDMIWSWLDVARDRIQLAAQRRGLIPRDFATTLIVTIALPEIIVVAHVGDGAVVARLAKLNNWSLLSGPHNGQYASTTYFATDDPCPALRITRHRNIFDAVASFSDGIEGLVLEAKTSIPSDAFFTPMARPLDATTVIGRDRQICENLMTFLSSERINERTDDDKTLIIAVTKL